MPSGLDLLLLDHNLAICRQAPDSPVPDWAQRGTLWSITRTPEELSLVCEAGNAPPGIRAEYGWRAIQVKGPLDFSIVGVLAALAEPLAEAGIPIFVVSTFDTDYLLIKEKTIPQAVTALSAAGHRIKNHV